MAQARAVNHEDECHVGGRNAKSNPAQQRKMSVHVASRGVGQTEDDVREVTRVWVGHDPVRVTECVEKRAIKAERIADPQQNPRNDEEERATSGDREENRTAMAACGERCEKDDGVEFEADREGEETSGGRAVAACAENEHAQKSHYHEYARLSPPEINHNRPGGKN